MNASYKNNYKKLFRQTYLVFAGMLIAIPFIIDAVAGSRPHTAPFFNKILADTTPVTRKDSSILPLPAAVPAVADTNILSPDADTSGVTVDTLFVPKISKELCLAYR